MDHPNTRQPEATVELEIRLFATLKDRAGRDRVRLSLDLPSTVARLSEALAAAYPALAASLPTALFAINKAYAGPDTPVTAGDEVAVFPPVSGGSDDEFTWPTYFAVTREPLDLNEVIARLTRPDVGAVVTFTGAVRGETRRDGLPGETLYLEYEAYEAMATRKMAQIAREMWRRWPLVKGVAIVQRIGRLEIGQMTTLVACAAGHRDEGCFDAARYGIDRLKEIVPVWKKEVGADRSVWVEGHYRPTEADEEERPDLR